MGYIDIFYSWSIFAAVLVPIVLLLIRRVGPARRPSRGGTLTSRGNRCAHSGVPSPRA